MVSLAFVLFTVCLSVSMDDTHIGAMTVTYFGQCQDLPATPILSKQGPTSLNICMTECAVRPACQMIGFASRAKICWLFNSTQLNRTSGTVVKNCMYIRKSDFDELHTQVSIIWAYLKIVYLAQSFTVVSFLNILFVSMFTCLFVYTPFWVLVKSHHSIPASTIAYI